MTAQAAKVITAVLGAICCGAVTFAVVGGLAYLLIRPRRLGHAITRWWVLVPAAIFALLAGGFVMAVPVSERVTSTVGTPSPQQKPPSSPSASQASPSPKPLTGLGATDAVWNDQHASDPSRSPGCCYERQSDDTDHLAFVTHTEGLITSFRVQYLQPMPLAGVRADLTRLLPPDAVTVFQAAKDTCEVDEYQSNTLGALYAARPSIGDPQGYIEIVLTSLDVQTNDSTYHTDRVTDADVNVGSGPGDQSGSC
jgi:hypothetical protein